MREVFGSRLAAMARDLLAQQSVQATLDRIVLHAVDLIDGCDGAGILTLRGGEAITLAATDEKVRTSDRIQAELGEGPCFDAIRNREQTHRIEDMTAGSQQWPAYAPRACELGFGSTMGFLLFTDGRDSLGALNLYSTRPKAFTEGSELAGWLLASHAAVALSSARTHDQLQHAMDTRHNIGEAVGILRERHNLTEEQALAVLREASQDHNTKLRDVARTVTENG